MPIDAMPVQMIGATFEYEGVPMRTKLYRGETCRYFVTVLDQFRHHYTGEMVYEIRLEWKETLNSRSEAERKYIEPDMLESLWQMRIKEGEE